MGFANNNVLELTQLKWLYITHLRIHTRTHTRTRQCTWCV